VYSLQYAVRNCQRIGQPRFRSMEVSDPTPPHLPAATTMHTHTTTAATTTTWQLHALPWRVLHRGRLDAQCVPLEDGAWAQRRAAGALEWWGGSSAAELMAQLPLQMPSPSPPCFPACRSSCLCWLQALSFSARVAAPP
jgi:hypothetical protein